MGYNDYYGKGSGYGGSGMPIVYQGTITGLRISAVDGGATASGGAFIDNAGATIPTFADGNHQIEIYDPAVRMIKGVLKAPGAGLEGLDSELLANNNFASAEPPGTAWGRQAGWTVAGGVAVATLCAADAGLYQTVASTEKMLIKCSVTMATLTAGSFYFFATGVNFPLPPYITAAGTYTQYLTGAAGALDGLFMLRSVEDNSSGTASLMTVKQVLTPSTYGSTIVSAKGGVTYNWASKNALFAYNESSYYCVIKRLR
jgi:hypothetical protein